MPSMGRPPEAELGGIGRQALAHPAHGLVTFSVDSLNLEATVLDLKLIRDDPETVRAALARRGGDAAAAVDRLLELDATRRALVTEVDGLRAEQKRGGRDVASAPPEERARLLASLKDLAARLDQAEGRLRTVDTDLYDLLARVPNLPDPSVPPGGEDDAEELRQVGTVPALGFPVRDHLELGELLGAIDTVRAAKVSGARFGYLTGPGAMLEFSLVRFAMDLLAGAGFTPMVPPVLVRREAMFGTGFLPTDEQQIFRTADDDLYLAGTSEVPLVSYHADEILDPADLPRRYVGFSTCFRREAGSYGNIAAGDLGGSAAKKYDCEAWIPSQETWRELTSTSNCTDYQARRIGCRVREATGNRPVHTLNGTAIAVGRTIIALLENHQQHDGSVHVPKALQPYFGTEVIAPASG